MNNFSVIENLVQNHPDVFTVLLLRFNKNIKTLKVNYPDIFDNWPKGIDYNIPSIIEDRKFTQNSKDAIRNFLNTNRKNNYLNYSEEFRHTHHFEQVTNKVNDKEYKAIIDFISSHLECFDRKNFSTKANIKWNETFINSFPSLIYWGINTDKLEKEFLESLGNEDNNHSLFYRNRPLKYKRLEKGGLSYNQNLNLNLKMLKKYEKWWDYYALLNNPSIDWDYASFKFLKAKFLRKEDQRRFQYEKDRVNEELKYLSLIGMSLPNRAHDYKYWNEEFDTNPKFIIVDKILHKKLNLEEINDLLLEISDVPSEKYGLEYIYTYSSISYTFSEKFIINFSLESLDTQLDEWFTNASVPEIRKYVNLLDFEKIKKVKEILIEVHWLFRHLNNKGSTYNSDSLEIKDQKYCPACQESPCRCSDPDPN